MARVYERPRYINQARNKLLALASATKNTALALSVGVALHAKLSVRYVTAVDYESLAELAMDDALQDDDMPNLDTQLEQYLLDHEIGAQSRAARLAMPEAASKVVQDFLAVAKHQKPHTVLTDEYAMFWLISECLADATVTSETLESRVARAAAHDLIHQQLMPQKIAPGAFSSAFKMTSMRGSPPSRAAIADRWLTACENLQFRAHPMWVKHCRIWACPPRRVRDKTQRIIEKVQNAGALERHKIDGIEMVMPGSVSYNYSGVIVVYAKGNMLVLDASGADYLRTAVTSYRNATWAFSMLRVSGTIEPHDYTTSYVRCIRWIQRSVEKVTNARYVARHMHLAYTRWQNLTCETSANVDCGYSERDIHLKKDMLKYYPHTDEWYSLVMSLPVSERLRAEFFKLYHLLPPPDIDPLLVHTKLLDMTSTPNSCSRVAIAEFVNFCKSYDLCRFLAKRRTRPKVEAMPGYEFEESSWFKRSLSGKHTMPPTEEYGKAWVSKEFPYDPTGDFHVFDAKDCTRVVADRDKYMLRSESRSLPRADQNELLSAIFNGPILSNGETMSVWRSRVMAGKLTAEDNIIAAEAGKAENTKPDVMVRETLSACDTAREFLTEVDHSLRPLADLTPGVSIRVDLVRHKRKFQAMAKSVSLDSPQQAFATSTDISKWSPKMPRAMFHAWQTYALGTTECENPKAPIALWDKLELFVDRRGVKAIGECTEGNIQGWPATSDTTMHAHILIMWAYKLRDERILSPKEAAYTLCLIDDATTVVALEGNPDECKLKALRAKEMLAKIYLDLGFIMDEVKSFFSSIKFVYLNELYIDGAQVGHASKTLMRINRDYTRRFSSLTDNIATAFGTASSAATQGADPFVAYWMAAWMSFRWVFKLEPDLMKVGTPSLTIAALAPASLNGLGIRCITSVMATGELDHLTWFIEVAGTLCSFISSDHLDGIFSSFLLQPHAAKSAVTTFKDPFSLSAQQNRSATTAIREAFRDAARSHGLAEPFLSLDKIETSTAYESALDTVLQAGSYEAALLEEVSSCMPESFVDEVMGRVDRTELISYLLGSRAIGNLRRRVDSCDRMNMKQLVDILCSSRQAHGDIDLVRVFEESGSFLLAYELRESAYALTPYVVLNHTYPCPFSLWAFAGEVDLESDLAQRVTTVSFSESRLRKTAGSDCKNMYDSNTSGIGFKGYRSVGSNVANEARVALYNPVRRKIGQGLAAFRWAADAGAHHTGLMDIFLMSWSGHRDPRLLELPGKRFEGSAKRLSMRHTKSNHVVLPFVNCQSAVRVDARAVTRKLAEKHTMHDMMAAITLLRCSALLEAALHMRNGDGSFAYGFRFKPTAQSLLQVPSSAPRAVPLSTYAEITPFTSIDSPLSGAAAAVTSFEAMSRALQVYTLSGVKAANAVFESMVENEEMLADVVRDHHQVVERAIAVDRSAKYSDAAKAWSVTRVRSKPSSAGSVKDDPRPPSSASSVVTQEPAMLPRSVLRTIGRTWADNITLDLVHAEAMFANHIHLCYVKHNISDVLLSDDWSAKSHLVRPKPNEVSKIVSDAEGARSDVPSDEALIIVLRAMGAIGLRISPEATDRAQVVNSFLGTTTALLGMCTVIGATIENLRHRTSESYSSVNVLSGPLPVRMVSRVIGAQWLAAAARRQYRCDQAMKSGASGRLMTIPNYEAAFLRASARALNVTGSMNMVRLNLNIVSQAIRSASRRIQNAENQDAFIMRVEDAELEEVEPNWGHAEAKQRVIEVVTLAQSLGADIDIPAVAEALDTVITWVTKDIQGAHKVLRPPERLGRITTVLRGGSVEPTILPMTPAPLNPELMRPLVIPQARVGEEMGEDVDSAEPQCVFQWVADEHPEVLHGERHYDEYAVVTSTRDSYLRWLQSVKDQVDTSAYAEPRDVLFDVAAYESISDNVVQE